MKSITDSSDADLCALAEGSAAIIDRVTEAKRHGALGVNTVAEAEEVLRQLKDVRDEARAARAELDEAAVMMQNLNELLIRTKAELAAKTAALRLADPEGVQRRIEAAWLAGQTEAAAALESELVRLRDEAARQRSEIDELRASKKKLREALERAKAGR